MKQLCKRFLIGASICSLLCVGAAAEFHDVPSSAWYADSVAKMASAGVISGINATTFAPDSPVTRAQFVKMLACLSGDDLTKYQSTAPTFSDTGTASSWWHTSVEWANACHITTGDGHGHFNPNSQITRQEMAAMLTRYATAESVTLPTGSGNTSYPAWSDEHSIASWAKDCVNTCRHAGLISGYPSGEFCPNGHTTRAQAAKVIAGMSACHQGTQNDHNNDHDNDHGNGHE